MSAPAYTLAVHERTHWTGHAPLDCAWCIAEASYAWDQPAEQQQPEPYRSPAPAIVAVLLAWACVGATWWALAVPGINLGHAALILSAAAFLRMARHLPEKEES